MISVVIPAYNEEGNISACFDALVKQKTNRQFEVILVDNNSTDETVKEAKKYLPKLDLKIVLEKQKGRSPARKKGFEKSRSNIILSTDADGEVPENWVETMARELGNQEMVAITGPCSFSGLSRYKTAWLNWFQPFAMRAYRLVFGHYWLSGFNFGIKRAAYIKSGGFNPVINIQEDVDLSFRVSKLGNIKYVNLPVSVSGRRFRQGIVKPMWPYVKTWFDFFILKKKNIVLSDVRQLSNK